jgi:hypothetical protein
VIIIFGLRRLRKAMGTVLLRCANCGMTPVGLLRVSTWFALFFIPVIPVSFKHYTVCPNCKRLDQISKADIDRAHAQAAAMATAGHEGSRGVAPAPATLEHAVNHWASAGQPSSIASAPAVSAAPVSVAATPAPPPLPPAGWYADPSGGPGHRYWDGQRWTEQTTPAAPPS